MNGNGAHENVVGSSNGQSLRERMRLKAQQELQAEAQTSSANSSYKAASDDGVGSSSSLSLRERMRLKAQQELQDKAQAASSTNKPIGVTALGAIDVDSDEENLGSLMLGSTKRQAALKRPASYSIDPLNDSSRLKRHPHRLPTSLAKYAAVPASKTSMIDGLLREQRRKIKRGTDADGFSRAEAIATSMEHERLGRMGIAISDVDSENPHLNHDKSSRLAKVGPIQAKGSKNNLFRYPLNLNAKEEEQEMMVRALSPTIPSFLWSSQSEASGSDDEAEHHVDANKAKQQLAASLAAVGADEDEKQLALNIFQSDAGGSKTGHAPVSKAHIKFYRSDKVLAPVATYFCPLPSVEKDPEQKQPISAANAGTSAQTSLPPISNQPKWDTLAQCILLAGMLPPSLGLDRRQIRRILVWLAITFILERGAMQSQLTCALFRSLIFQPEKSHYAQQLDAAIPRALTDVVRRVPHILSSIGMDPDVFEKCFPDHPDVADVACFSAAPAKLSALQKHEIASSSSTSAVACELHMYLTQTERDDVLINLARMLDMIAGASTDAAFVEDKLSILAGYICSMAIACAASTNYAVSDAIGRAFDSIFGAATQTDSDLSTKLQAEVCQRTFSALSDKSIAARARLVTRFPGESKEVCGMTRWLAWCALTEHVAPARCATQAVSRVVKADTEVVPSSDPFADEAEGSDEVESKNETENWRQIKFEPFSLDLEMLASAIDARGASSPFRVVTNSVGRAGDADARIPFCTVDDGRAIRFETLLGATQLASVALRELPIHMCTFSPSDRTSVCDPHIRHDQLGASSRALRLALEPYLALHPRLDRTRIAALHTIIQRLSLINSRIRDNSANVILQTLAKDSLQTLSHSLEYQLHMYSSTAIASSFIV